jgi:hypothetical protein
MEDMVDERSHRLVMEEIWRRQREWSTVDAVGDDNDGVQEKSQRRAGSGDKEEIAIKTKALCYRRLAAS